jgi:hypothetical protein
MRYSVYSQFENNVLMLKLHIGNPFQNMPTTLLQVSQDCSNLKEIYYNTLCNVYLLLMYDDREIVMSYTIDFRIGTV